MFQRQDSSVRKSTGGYPVQSSLVHQTATQDEFTECSEDIKGTIMSQQSKSCELDPLPTNTLKEFHPEILPFLVDICNALLQQGMLPPSQRHATIMPRIKKPKADPTDVKNYRPILNLTFSSKLIERL